MFQNIEKRVSEFFTGLSKNFKNKINKVSDDAKYRIITGALLATTLGIAIGCSGGGGGGDNNGGSDGGGEKTELTEFVYASKGTTMQLDNYKLTIPAGALKNNATVKIAKSSYQFPSLDDVDYASKVLEIDLNNTGLNSKIGITIPYSQPLSKIENISSDDFLNSLVGLVYNYNTGTFSMEEISIDNSQNTMTINFSSDQLIDTLETTAASLPNIVQPASLNTSVLTNFPKDINSSSSSPACLLIHGFSGKAKDFGTSSDSAGLVYYLKDIYGDRIWTFEYPSWKNVRTNVETLEENIKELNPDFKFDIIGHSMGGILARDFTRRNPDYVRKLVMLGAPNEGVTLSALQAYVNMSMLRIILEPLIAIQTPGVSDLRTGSSYLDNNLNTNMGSLPAQYFTLAGKYSNFWIIGEGNNDGLVAEKSVHIDDGSPLQQETPASIESYTKDGTNHWDLIRYNGGCFDRIKDFLSLNVESEKIIFSSDRDGDYEIYTINSDGSGLEKISDNDNIQDILPIWSPDHSKIAFSSDKDTNYNFELYVMDSDGKNVKRLTRYTNGADSFPGGWSPDGKNVIYSSDIEGDEEIFVVDIASNTTKNLTNNTIDDYLPTFSPTGNLIAFTSEMQVPYVEIFTMNADGSNQKRLTYSTNTWWINQSPDWSPDGKFILFDTNRDGLHAIYKMNNDGSNIQKVFEDPYSKYGCYGPKWSSDGKKIIFEGGSKIYIINNDGTSLIEVTSGKEPDW